MSQHTPKQQSLSSFIPRWDPQSRDWYQPPELSTPPEPSIYVTITHMKIKFGKLFWCHSIETGLRQVLFELMCATDLVKVSLTKSDIDQLKYRCKKLKKIQVKYLTPPLLLQLSFALQGQMLKGPPANPRDYIYRTSNISPREGRQYVRKYINFQTNLGPTDVDLFFRQTSGLHMSTFFLTPPMLQTSDLDR